MVLPRTHFEFTKQISERLGKQGRTWSVSLISWFSSGRCGRLLSRRLRLLDLLMIGLFAAIPMGEDGVLSGAAAGAAGAERSEKFQKSGRRRGVRLEPEFEGGNFGDQALAE